MVKVLFIAGTSYCGSTLTSLVLNAHPAMASVGELTGPIAQVGPDYPCSCGSLLRQCDFWQSVSKRAADADVDFGMGNWNLRFLAGRTSLSRRVLTRSTSWEALDRLRHEALSRLPAVRAQIAEIGERNRVVIDAILEQTGARVFVDASKDPVRALLLNGVPGLEVWLLHLVRDPRGFVASNRTYSRHGIWRSARIWNRSFQSVECARKALPAERFLRVRYEDLCQDLAGELGRITEFVGVEPFALPVHFLSNQHVIGNKMRKSSSEEIRLDERWRERLTPQESSRVEQLTTRIGREVGYG